MAGSVWNGHVSIQSHEHHSGDSLVAALQTRNHTGLMRGCVCVYGVCLCLHVCYSKAKRGVDSFMCTVWSGLSCYQAHTADNSKITHSHTHIQLHVNINCSSELQNYKEVTLLRWFFKSVLYGDISFILFCNSRKLLRADIPSASYFMLIWKNTVLFWHHTLTEQMFFC